MNAISVGPVMAAASRTNALGRSGISSPIAPGKRLAMNTVRSAVGGYGLRPAAVGYRRAKRSELNVGFEELLLVLLAVVALFGIAYGFSCAVDLVQHWAVFERGAANLI